jgi:hypothetical protein
MKQQWTTQELIDHWTLTSQEVAQIQSVSQTAYNQIGYGVLFKTFQRDGKFRVPPRNVRNYTIRMKIIRKYLYSHNSHPISLVKVGF